jgi:hypothetical protein
MSILTDATGAQILPPAEDSRATVTAWFAYVSADGDQRTKYPEWAALAGTLYPQIGSLS